MKKLFALLLLPSLAFAGKIGENYVGVSLGDFKWENTNTTQNIDMSGLAFELKANYSIYQNKGYGVDIYAEFLSANGLDGTPALVEVDFSKFDALVRPYYKVQEIVIFANLGVSSLSSDVGGIELIDKSAFIPGVGLELSVDKLTFSPYVDFVDYGDPASGIFWILPLHYQINSNIGASFKFLGSGLDDYVSSGVTQENDVTSWSLGLDYKF
jgi:hypothetical protein